MTTEDLQRAPAAGAKVPDWSNGLTLRADDMFIGVYQPSPETAGYWQGVAEGKLLLKHCRACGTWHHPRRIACSNCRSLDLEWKPAEGVGEVYSFSEIFRAADAFSASAPFVVGIVRLSEGVHLFTRFVASDNKAVTVGATVKVDFRVLEGGLLLPVFVVEEATQ